MSTEGLGDPALSRRRAERGRQVLVVLVTAGLAAFGAGFALGALLV